MIPPAPRYYNTLNPYAASVIQTVGNMRGNMMSMNRKLGRTSRTMQGVAKKVCKQGRVVKRLGRRLSCVDGRACKQGSDASSLDRGVTPNPSFLSMHSSLNKFVVGKPSSVDVPRTPRVSSESTSGAASPLRKPAARPKRGIRGGKAGSVAASSIIRYSTPDPSCCSLHSSLNKCLLGSPSSVAICITPRDSRDPVSSAHLGLRPPIFRNCHLRAGGSTRPVRGRSLAWKASVSTCGQSDDWFGGPECGGTTIHRKNSGKSFGSSMTFGSSSSGMAARGCPPGCNGGGSGGGKGGGSGGRGQGSCSCSSCSCEGEGDGGEEGGYTTTFKKKQGGGGGGGFGGSFGSGGFGSTASGDSMPCTFSSGDTFDCSGSPCPCLRRPPYVCEWGRAALAASLGAHLLVAAHEGDVCQVRRLLAAGADANFCAAGRWTPLHRACAKAHTCVVQALLSHNACPNAATSCGFTPLHLASLNDYSAETVGLLVHAGSDVDAWNRVGQAPLHLAASCGNAKAVKTLKDAGASLVARDDAGNTPCDVASTFCVRQILNPCGRRRRRRRFRRRRAMGAFTRTYRLKPMNYTVTC